MGIIVMILIGVEVIGVLNDLLFWLVFMYLDVYVGDGIVMWIVLICVVVMVVGIVLGGWKIIKILGYKMVKLYLIYGFVVEISLVIILILVVYFGMLVLIMYSIFIVIMGVGFVKNLCLLKFGVIECIVWVWILIILVVGGCVYLILKLFELFGWI